MPKLAIGDLSPGAWADWLNSLAMADYIPSFTSADASDEE
jgi:hypothetical protein